MRRWGREEGVSWTNRSPIGQTLLHRIRQSSGLDPEVLVELRYTDGYLLPADLTSYAPTNFSS
jgi:hypothetical protein